MNKYRVTFSRLAKTEEETQKLAAVRLFTSCMVQNLGNERAIKYHKEYEKDLGECLLEDLIFESEKDDLDGRFFMDNYILDKFPEAKLQSWDKF